MNLTAMLEILYLSNYEFILYRDNNKKLFLNLTRESGFGVYDFCFEIELSDTNNQNSTFEKIEDLRTKYLSNATAFSSKYVEVKLESMQTKLALENWMRKNKNAGNRVDGSAQN